MSRITVAFLLLVCLAAQATDPVESLHAAAKSGDTATIRKLVAAGVDVNAISKGGGTPLLTSVNWNNFEAAKTFISLGANVNFQVGQWTPLIQAIGRDTRIVKLLIEAGANVNYADPIFGYSPLSSVARNRSETFEKLTKSGGYVGPFPDSVETVRLLIKAGANVNNKDRSGETPLRNAISSNNIDIAQLLLKAGADVNERNSVPEMRTYTGTDDPVLFDSVSGYSYKPEISLQITGLLLKAGADPNYRSFRPYDADFDSKGITTDGYTALTFAARWGYLPIVELLLEYGADPCLVREDGVAAATIAEKHNHKLVAKKLQQATKTKCSAP